jgi:transposase-like protein
MELSCTDLSLHKIVKKMNQEKTAQIIEDHEVGKLSYRKLSKKHGLSKTMIFNMLKENQKKEEVVKELEPVAILEEISSMDEKAVREELRKIRLENELLKIVIDITSQELGVDLLKKAGTRQSQ